VLSHLLLRLGRSTVLVVATTAGIILAIGVVLLLVLDRTLRNATEAEELVKLLCLVYYSTRGFARS